MTEQLEIELREALVARAAQVPDEAIERLRGVDYRPGPRPRFARMRTRFALGAVVGGAGIAGAVVALAGPGASSAFAGWSPTPTAPTPLETATAVSTCENGLVTTAPAGSAGPSAPTALSGPTAISPGAGGWQVELTDTRGPFTAVILQSSDGTTTTSCITGPSFSATTASIGARAAAAGDVEVSGSHLVTPGGNPYSFAEGHAGLGVTGVVLTLADGTQVTATTENGWFVAWWPGSEGSTSAQVTTASGTTTQAVNLSTAPTLTPACQSSTTPCSASSSVSTPSGSSGEGVASAGLASGPAAAGGPAGAPVPVAGETLTSSGGSAGGPVTAVAEPSSSAGPTTTTSGSTTTASATATTASPTPSAG